MSFGFHNLEVTGGKREKVAAGGERRIKVSFTFKSVLSFVDTLGVTSREGEAELTRWMGFLMERTARTKPRGLEVLVVLWGP